MCDSDKTSVTDHESVRLYVRAIEYIMLAGTLGNDKTTALDEDQLSQVYNRLYTDKTLGPLDLKARNG